MPKTPRVTAKIFASNAAPDDIGQFGSALTGSKVFTSDISQIQALPAYEIGWRAAVLSDRNYPTLQEMNGLQKSFSQQLAYILETGIPEWDAETTYWANTSFCQVEGVWYQSLTDNNIGNNPTTDSTNWRKVTFGDEGGGGGDDKADTDLNNLTPDGRLQFNPFSINSGETDETGTPSFLQDSGDSITTVGTIIASTAPGRVYTITDTLTASKSELSSGTYNIWLDPVAKTLTLDQNNFTIGKAFPANPAEGDYLLNISKPPYVLEVYNASGNSVSNKILCGTITL